MSEAPPWVVLKFGGTSVSSADRWAVIERVVRERLSQNRRVLVVHSALAGVSNRLDALATAAGRDDTDVSIEALLRQHLALAQELGFDASPLLHPWIQELRRLATGMTLLREASPKTRAQLMALGELMATTIGAAFLNRRGIDTRWVDAREHLVCEPDPNASEASRYLTAQCSHRADATLEVLGPCLMVRS